MMVSGSFSKLLAPGLDKIFHTAHNEVPEMWTRLFNMESSSKKWEEHFSYAGFEPFQQLGELEDIQLRDAVPGFTVRYQHRKWGLGYQLSRELVDDNLYPGTLEVFPAWLARSARATKETVAATVLNLGFSSSQPGGDGKPLFATDHPLAGAGGGTYANTFSTPRALSVQALKDARLIAKRTVADDNIFAPVDLTELWVPDALEDTAREILGTERMPYSADNTINVVSGRYQVNAWSYLTDEDNWFLKAPTAQTQLTYFERWPLRQIMKDRDENLSMVHLAYERYSFGFSDWRGIFGAQGA